VSSRKRKGVHKGKEGQQSWSPPERHAGGTFGSHRTDNMEDARARRLARIRSSRSGKFTDEARFEEER